MSVKGVVWVLAALLLQACGGGGKSTGSANPPTQSFPAAISSSSNLSSSASLNSSVSSSLSSSSTSSAIVSSMSSASSLASSIPADLPQGVAEALPVLSINTNNGAAIVSKDDYLTANFALTDANTPAVEGSLEIRGRGNSTWSWPKKPYKLKLSSATSLLTMPASKHWVLLANYADKTLMRNDIAFMFSRNLGMAYTPRSQVVELKVNGTYQGVYQLSEHIRIDKNRVNIPELKVTDTDADKITGGYLMEVDFRLNKSYCVNNGWDSVCKNGVNTQRDIDFCIDSAHGMDPACLANPETLHDPAWSAQRAYIEKYYADMEAALYGSSFANPTTGYAAYLDVDSVIDYYLVNEVFKNVDGAVASFYLYKPRGGKLFFGPVWDFDLGLGNAGYNDVDKTYGWHIRKASWFARLFQDPAFDAKVKARWQLLKSQGKLDYIYEYAQARALWLDKQQQKNYQLWSISDFAAWIFHAPLGTYELEVKELIRWQKARVAWMDTELSK